jgi:tetratricopeptide (TPR) repeat protein
MEEEIKPEWGSEQDSHDQSALETNQKALQDILELFGENHSDTAQSYYNIGVTQYEMEDYKSALESDQHALQIRLKLFGENNPDTARSYYSIGVTQYEMKFFFRASFYLEHTLTISKI